MNRILKYTNNISLKNKLIFLFLLVSVIPVLILGIVSFNISTNINKEKEIDEKLHKLDSIKKDVIYIIKEKELVGIRFHLNDTVQALLNSKLLIDKSKKKKYEFEVKKLLLDYKYLHGTNSIFLFSTNGDIYSNKNDYKISFKYYQEKEWYKEAIMHGKKYFWGNTENIYEEYVIPYVRIVTDKRTSNNIGVFVLNLKESLLESTYKTSFVKGFGFYCIVNERNIIISHPIKKYLGKNIVNSYSINSLNIDKEKGYFEDDIDGERYLFIYNLDEQTGWKYFSIVPVEEILQTAKNIKKTAMFLSVLCILVCLMISSFLSLRVIRPIEKLINIMSKAENGNLEVKFMPHYNDEIGKLGASFDKMISKLKKSIDDIIAIQKEKREAELKVLEFQINPHFLYNTLSSIIWLANANRNEDVIKMTSALSTFFRISISKGREFITIGEEINHVKSYLEIQKTRYIDEFVCIYDIDIDIFNFYTIKLVIQPIVENAIYHGIKSLVNKKGIIKVEGYIEGDVIVLKVKDNGESITDEKIKYINAVLDGQIDNIQNFGIGVRNVNDRIKLHFGKKYGLKYSKQGVYTVAEILIPILRKEDIGV